MMMNGSVKQASGNGTGTSSGGNGGKKTQAQEARERFSNNRPELTEEQQQAETAKTQKYARMERDNPNVFR